MHVRAYLLGGKGASSNVLIMNKLWKDALLSEGNGTRHTAARG